MKKINLKIIFTLVILIFSFKGYSQKNKNKEYPMPLISLKSGSLVSYVKILKLDSNSVKILTLNLDTTSYYFNEIKNIDAVKTGYSNYIVLKKLQEEKLKKENEERDKQIILNENQRKENTEKRSSELKNITSNDYFFIGYGSGQSMWGKDFENLANSYKLIVPIEHSNNVTFKSYDIFVEYVRNFSDKKNIFINLNFKNYTTTFLSNELNLNFISNSYALNFGYNFYQNRFFQSGVGSGLIYTQSNVATDIDNRTNVLCGKTDFYSIPIFLNLRSAFLLSKIPAFIYIKPAFNINLLSTNSTNNYCITAGLGIFLKK
jgi:hypothetical protein